MFKGESTSKSEKKMWNDTFNTYKSTILELQFTFCLDVTGVGNKDQSLAAGGSQGAHANADRLVKFFNVFQYLTVFVHSYKHSCCCTTACKCLIKHWWLTACLGAISEKMTPFTF